jgi:hypothetical protein
VRADDSQNALSLDFQTPVNAAVFEQLPRDLPQWIAMAYASFDNGVIRATRPVSFLTRREPDGFSLRIVARGPVSEPPEPPPLPPPPPLRGGFSVYPPPAAFTPPQGEYKRRAGGAVGGGLRAVGIRACHALPVGRLCRRALSGRLSGALWRKTRHHHLRR